MAIKTIGKFYTSSATAIAVAANAALGYTTTKTSGSIRSTNGDTIQILAPGVYNIAVNITYVATAAGTVEADLYADGVAVPGASGSATIAAVGDTANISFNTVLTVKSAISGIAALQVLNTGVASSYTVNNVIVERVA